MSLGVSSESVASVSPVVFPSMRSAAWTARCISEEATAKMLVDSGTMKATKFRHLAKRSLYRHVDILALLEPFGKGFGKGF